MAAAGRGEPPMTPGDPVIYKHAEGWRPAEYLGRYGARHLIRIGIPRGARGKGLRYVQSSAIAPPDLPDDSQATSTPEHP
jgi:hypothetical protein